MLKMPFVWERKVLGFSNAGFVVQLFNPCGCSELQLQVSKEQVHLAGTNI